MDANIIIYSALFIAGIAALCMLSLYAHELISTRRRAYKLIEEALQDKVGETPKDFQELNREDLKERIHYEESPKLTETEWKFYTVVFDNDTPVTAEDMAKITGYSESYASHSLKRLRDLGMVDISRREDGKRYRPHRYYPIDI